MDKLISIIIPVYNVEKYLDKCINSIVNQTYKNLEIILVDDGSLDNCSTLCDEWARKDNRIRVIHKKNGGVSSARNAGLDIMTGDFVAFVDPDDYLELEMYEKLLTAQTLHNSEIVLCRFNEVKDGCIYHVYENDLEKFCQFDDLTRIYFWSDQIKYKKNLKLVKNSVMGALWRGIYSANLFTDLRFNEIVFCMEDCLVWDELLKDRNVKMSYINDYLYNYSVREGSLTHHEKQVNRFKSDVNYVNAVSDILCDATYLSLVRGLRFFWYVQFVINKEIFNIQVDLTPVKNWGDKACYKDNKKYTRGFKRKIGNFLVYHKLYNVMKLCFNLKRKIKKLLKHG